MRHGPACLARRAILRKKVARRARRGRGRPLSQAQGYRILARGHDSRLGELDIIAVDGRTVVFVEVKTRTLRPTPAIRPKRSTTAKQRRMTQAALAYLKAKRLLQYAARFDVVAITWPEDARTPTIEHFKNAFSPVGSGQFFS